MIDIVSGFKNEIQQNLALFYLQLYLMDVHVEPEAIQYIKKSKYYVEDFFKEEDKKVNFIDKYRTFKDFSGSAISEYFAADTTDNDILLLEEGIRRKVKNYKFDSSLKIKKSDWTPDGLKKDYETEFYNWINRINEGWQYCGDNQYHRFDLYRRQAYNWCAQELVWDNSSSEEAKMDFLKIERKRMLTNSLYTLNKYGFIRNNLIPKYIAWEAQEVMLYLFDLSLSYILGKARQIGATTTLGASTGIKTGLQTDFQTKMVAEKGDKSEELFRDKIKYVIDKFPSYLTPTIANDTASVLRFLKKLGKGKTTGANSVFEVEAPTITCINGGSPQVVLLDEIGEMDIFGDIMSQARPALFGLNPKTGEQEMIRQVIAWGTGGNMDKGGGAMEREFRSYLSKWQDRDFTGGLIPLFLNCYARKGVTQKMYDSEKALAYSQASEGKMTEQGRDPRIAFHQAMPVTIDDMFLISSDTIIPVSVIDKKLKDIRICKEKRERLYIRGHFVPIYDNSVKMPSDFDTPYKIIGAKFIPASDKDILVNSPSACVTIISKPEYDWEDRYYKGVDPVFTASGHSNFGTAIFDDYKKDIASYIDFKYEDYRYCYLQSLLLNLFYSPFKNGQCTGIPELVESNVGGEYISYVKERGFRKILVKKEKLPEVLQIGGDEYGIKKHANAPFIINQLEQLLVLHTDTLMADRFFEQLKTYVRKVTKSMKNFTYEPSNKKYHRDDLLDGVLYSWICRQSFSKKVPRHIHEERRTKTVWRYEISEKTGYTQQLVKKQVSV